MLSLPHAFSHQFNLAGFDANESKAKMIKKGVDSILEAGVHRASSIKVAEVLRAAGTKWILV